MTLRDDLLPTLEDARQLVEDLGLRQTRVWVRRGTWSEGEIKLGTLTTSDTEITPRPKVEIQGRNLKVSKITPDFSTGGWAPSDLSPESTANVDVYFVVQFAGGPLQAYRLDAIDTSRAFGYTLYLEPLDIPTPDEY